jgi:hypothetical protein
VADLDLMKWVNLITAALGSLAAFGALNKMVWGTTRPCIIGATLLIALGLAGQWLSLWREEWLKYVDTALYGGVLALTIATQRTHTWFLERWANPIASGITLCAAGVFLFGLLGGCAVQPPLCERWKATLVYDDDGQPVALQLSQAQFAHLAETMRALGDGKCRLPVPGERES